MIIITIIILIQFFIYKHTEEPKGQLYNEHQQVWEQKNAVTEKDKPRLLVQ
jgi:hypothetical protein